MRGLIIQNLELKSGRQKSVVRTNDNNWGLTYRKAQQQQLESLTAVLTGRKMPAQGQVIVNGCNLITAVSADRALVVIKTYPLLLRLLPVRVLLVRKLLLNWRFVLPAHINYLCRKYRQELIQKSTPNLKLTNLYLIVDLMVTTFVNQTIKIIDQRLNHYSTIINQQATQFWNQLKYHDQFGTRFQHQIKEFIKSKISARLGQERLTMLQVLSDTTDSLIDVYYALVKSDDTKVERNSKKQMCLLIQTKHLRVLKTRILMQRLAVVQVERNSKTYLKQLLRGTENALIRQDIKWSLAHDQMANLDVIKQWRMIYQAWWQQIVSFHNWFVTEKLSTMVRRLVKEATQKGLSCFNQQNQESSILIQPQSETPVSILFQAVKRVKRLLTALDFKVNWFKLTKSLSSFDLIIVELINAYFQRSKVILVKNLVNHLTRKELLVVKELLFKLRRLGWDFFLINFEVVSKNHRPPQLCDHYFPLDNILESI